MFNLAKAISIPSKTNYEHVFSATISSTQYKQALEPKYILFSFSDNVDKKFYIESYTMISAQSLIVLISIGQNIHRIYFRKQKLFTLSNIHSIVQAGTTLISLFLIIYQMDPYGIFRLVPVIITRLFSGIAFVLLIYMYGAVSRITFRALNQNKVKSIFQYDLYLIINGSLLLISLIVSCTLMHLLNRIWPWIIFTLFFVFTDLIIAIQMTITYIKLAFYFYKNKELSTNSNIVKTYFFRYQKFIIFSDIITMMTFGYTTYIYILWYISNTDKPSIYAKSDVYNSENIFHTAIFIALQLFFAFLIFYSWNPKFQNTRNLPKKANSFVQKSEKQNKCKIDNIKISDEVCKVDIEGIQNTNLKKDEEVCKKFKFKEAGNANKQYSIKMQENSESKINISEDDVKETE